MDTTRRFKNRCNIDYTSDLVTQGNEDGQIGGDDVIVKDASVDGYQLVNLNMRYEQSDNLIIFGRVTNLFDEKYETYGAMAESVFGRNGASSTKIMAQPSIDSLLQVHQEDYLLD